MTEFFSRKRAFRRSPWSSRCRFGYSLPAKERFECGVVQKSVATKTWTLVKDAVPKVASKTGVRVRDARTLSKVLFLAEESLEKIAVIQQMQIRIFPACTRVPRLLGTAFP